MIVESGRAVAKIELSPVLRGTVYEATNMRITKKAEEIFGFAEIPVISFEDLFAGKILAALDRQHPRDVFDIKGLFEFEGITERWKEAFMVYLISHNRRMVEILDPNILDITHLFEADFTGMTTNLVELSDLNETRAELIRMVQSMVNEKDLEFLVGFKEGHPDWSSFSLPHIKDLPAVKWKLQNLALADPTKRKEMVERLTTLFLSFKETY